MEFKSVAIGSSNVYREEVVVNLKNGLHLVPCSKISEVARGYTCEIRIYSGDLTVDAKAVFDLMTLGADQGTQLVLEAEGEEGAEAIGKLAHLFATDFESDGSVG